MTTSNKAGWVGLGPKVKASWDRKRNTLIPIECRSKEEPTAPEVIDPVKNV